MMDTKTGLGVNAERIDELQVSAARVVPESTRRAVVELGELDGRDGFQITAETARDSFGSSVAYAGDINNDGFADMLIGAPLFEFGTNAYYTDPGAAYVIYGSANGFPTQFSAADLNGTNGFRLVGDSHYYYNRDGYVGRDDTARSVSGVGDVNGDGIDDFAVSVSGSSMNGFQTGAAHIIFGAHTRDNRSIDLTNYSPSEGFVVHGSYTSQNLARSVGRAGDYNGDGLDDLIITSDVGAHLIYGRSAGFSAAIETSEINGSNGFSFNFARTNLNIGSNATSIGDANGDGLDDILISGTFDNEVGYGSVYILYGTEESIESSVSPGDLTGTAGRTIRSDLGYNHSIDAASAGDFNGDGIADFAISTSSFNIEARVEIILGMSDLYDDVETLDNLGGRSVSIILDGIYNSTVSISSCGDFNGDGYDDMIIGAPFSHGSNTGSGNAFIVFGGADTAGSTIRLSDLDGRNGVILVGSYARDYAGRSVSSAGDVNGDGYDDVIIGADGNGNGGAAYVIYGFASNVSPTPQDDAITVRAAEATSGDLFADNGDGADVDADGDALTVTAVNGAADGVGAALTLASGAMLTVGADGGFDYRTDGAYASLGTGETATEAFTYAISDGLGGTATATATLTVVGVNDAPQAAGESALATAGAAPLVIDVLANDTDVDASDVLFVRSVSGGTGSVSLTDGVVTYAADAFAELAEGTTALDTFSYVVADGHGGTDTGTVTVQVAGVNDAPEIGAVALALSADGQAAFDLAGVASDVDQGAALTYAISDVPDGTAIIEGSVLTFAGDGAWDALALGQTAQAVLDVTVTDEHGASATTAAALTITGVNDAPTALALTLTAGQDDEAATADLTGFASDVDEGAALTFALADGAPEGASVTADGTLDFALAGAFAALAGDETATRQIAYTVTDEHGASAGAVATLTILGANDAPTAAGAVLAVTEGGAGRLSLTDLTADIDAGAVLFVTLGEGASGAASLVDGTLLYEAGETFDALGAGETRTEVVRYAVTDEHGATASAEVAVTVRGLNDAPTLTGGAGRAVFTEDETMAAAIAAGVVFADVDSPDLGGAVVTAQLAGEGEDWFVMLRGDGIALAEDVIVLGGEIIGTFEARRDLVTVRMNDGADASDLQAVLDALAFSGGTSDDPTAGFGTVEVTVTDGAANDLLAPEGTQDGIASFFTEVEVVAVNDAPNAVDDDAIAKEKAQLVFDPRANDEDAEGDALAVTAIDGQAVGAGDAVTLASGATVTLMADGRLAYDAGEAFYGLTAGEAGADGFAYELTDAGGAVSLGEVSLTIDGEDGGLVWSGTAGADRHDGTADADVLDGGFGDDVLAGGDGADSLMGGAGDDVLYGDAGPEAVAAAMAALAEAGLA